MGKRGPEPKSAELESAQGFPGRRKSQTKKAIEAKTEQEKTLRDMQGEASDSCFVPPPPAHIPKRAQRIWIDRFADPATRLLFKSTDHRVIERYCFLLSEVERWTKKPPRSTYETTNTNGDRVIKANPEYTQMLSVMRELRSIEQVIGANPAARLGMEKNLRKPGEGEKTSTPREGAQPASAQKPSGPLGVLKAARNLN